MITSTREMEQKKKKMITINKAKTSETATYYWDSKKKRFGGGDAYLIFGGGVHLPDNIEQFNFVGTANCGVFVWHIFVEDESDTELTL